MDKLSLTTTIPVILIIALFGQTAGGSSGDINCTEINMFDYLGDAFYDYGFSGDDFGCIFTFQCPTDCLCVLSDRTITVGCLSGQSFHQVVYPSTFLKASFLNDIVYSNAGFNSSIEANADNIEYGASSLNMLNAAVWYNVGLTNITRDAFAAFNDDAQHNIMLSHNR